MLIRDELADSPDRVVQFELERVEGTRTVEALLVLEAPSSDVRAETELGRNITEHFNRDPTTSFSAFLESPILDRVPGEPQPQSLRALRADWQWSVTVPSSESDAVFTFSVFTLEDGVSSPVGQVESLLVIPDPSFREQVENAWQFAGIPAIVAFFIASVSALATYSVEKLLP